jgi:hypothetical protein
MPSPAYKTDFAIGQASIDIVIVEELPDYWLAQCLQIDSLNRAGPTPAEAYLAIMEACEANNSLFEKQSIAAPFDYWLQHREALPVKGVLS